MKVDAASMPRAAARLRRRVTGAAGVAAAAVTAPVLVGTGASGATLWAVAVVGCAGVAAGTLGVRAALAGVERVHRERERFFQGILDASPQPVSVADVDRLPGSTGGSWLYVNRPVQEAFGKPLEHFLGRPCHEWGANICQTPDCGRAALAAGRPETTFAQDFGTGLSHFRVRTSTLNDLDGVPAYTVEWVDPQEEVAHQLRVAADRATELSDLSARSVAEVTETAGTVAGAAEELRASINDLMTRASSISEGARNTEEVTGRTGQEVQSLADALVRLAKDSESVDEVSRSVAAIAAQTNLLALNATIESARAGAAGKGFAVVASEVKSLAQQSQQATDRIGTSLAQLREGIGQQAEDVVAISEHILGAATRASEIYGAVNEIAEGIALQEQAVRSIAESAATAAQATAVAQDSLRSTIAAVQEARRVAG